ncbi:MAG: hypothetical protein CVU87_00135 [Firmicutes bacterium HGW-Firmicutes-12]|jgi:flavodoxin|nr:MAG: hypothetical protein CVU87_00135 [Firmicutes bacterium HGW-Firmicutes-12]
MNIGITVHSQTGTTLKFAKIIEKELLKRGHTAEIIELKTDVPVNSGSVRNSKKFSILNIPDCADYDAVLFGGPVWAFSASPVLIACMKELKGLTHKKVIPFVTMGFTFSGLGGSQAIKLMSSMATNSGARVLPGKIVGKLFRNSTLLMEKSAVEIADCID